MPGGHKSRSITPLPQLVSSSYVVSAAPSFSHSSPAPAWGPSHRRQFSTNFSKVSPSHGVQSFRNRLLQYGSPMGSQVLPANLLQHGLLSPRVHRSCQEPALHGKLTTVSQPPSGIHLLQCGVPFVGCRWVSAPLWTSVGCRGTAFLTMVFSTSCRGISALASVTPSPSPSSLTLVSAEFSLLSLAAKDPYVGFFFFLL